MKGKGFTLKVTKLVLLSTIIAGSILPFASTVNAKSFEHGRVEFYDYSERPVKDKLANEWNIYDYEFGAIGAECTATIDIKGNDGKRDFIHPVKLKGTKGTNTDDALCEQIQAENSFSLGYKVKNNKSTIRYYDGGSYGFEEHYVNKQGYKIILSDYIEGKGVSKYWKSGIADLVYSKGYGVHISAIITFIIKNPKLMKNPRYKITDNFKRTPTISNKNVVIRNNHFDDGEDTITVNNLKNGTRLNIFNHMGQLQKSVEVNGTSYTYKVPRKKDIKKYLLSPDFREDKKNAEYVIISRTEPNSHESYRVKYKIPNQKPPERTPSGSIDSDIQYWGKLGVSIWVTDVPRYNIKDVSIQFNSMVGKQDTLYRIKYDGKEVYSFTVKANEYDEDDYYYKDFTNDPQMVDIFTKLKPKSLEDAKKYTITAQIDGKKESLPLQFYVNNSEKDSDNIGYNYISEND